MRKVPRSVMLLDDNRIQNSVDEMCPTWRISSRHQSLVTYETVYVPRLLLFFNNEAFEDYTALLDTVFRRK